MTWDGKERRVEDRRMCDDHETRIKLLEKGHEQINLRLDRTEHALTSIDGTLSRMQQDMVSHTALMNKHIDLSFRDHEINEMKMHKDMLVQAIKATAGGLFVVVTALGTVLWWIVQHLWGTP